MFTDVPQDSLSTATNFIRVARRLISTVQYHLWIDCLSIHSIFTTLFFFACFSPGLILLAIAILHAEDSQNAFPTDLGFKR